MKILFTTNRQWGSRFIRWCTGEKVSHVAILLDVPVVVHSTPVGSGTNILWYKDFLQHNTIIAEVSITNDDTLFSRLAAIEPEGYDWILLFTMAISRIWKRIPVVDNPYRNICTEVITEQILHITDKLTPGQLLTRLKERNNG